MTIKELQGIKNVEEMEGTHKFLTEELLVPNVNKADPTRINMFVSHLNQAEIINQAEPPKVFTNFENMVGKYSPGYKKSKKQYTVIKKIVKNKFNYVLVVVDENNQIDVIQRRVASRITESFGYIIDNPMDKYDEGDVIPKDDVLYKNRSYDENMNFSFGKNMKTVFLAYKDLTHEDKQ